MRVRHPGRWIAIGVLSLVVLLAIVVAVRWVQGRAEPVDPDEVANPTGSALPAEDAVLRPPQGVYVYEGSGTDRIDKPPTDRAQGPTMPATITHDPDSCWTFRIDYSTNHWQSWRYCPRAGGLDEVGGQSFQRWDFGAFASETTSTFECDAPTIRGGQQIGDEWVQSCSGTSTGVDGTTVSEGPYRFVGNEALTIGGEQVRAHRYHRERTTSGNQTGSESADVWFSAETGMPLRNERQVDAVSDTVIGEVRYSETAEFQLTSLAPRDDG